LLRTGDKAVLETEVARMTSLNNLLTVSGGFESWIFEDMVEVTTDLLRDLASLVQTSPQAASALLEERFNTPEISNTIVYHLRLLASSWLAGHRTTYQGYIEDVAGVDGYRKNVLEPVDNEIDHVGMVLLIDVLLKPIGFAVEIVYLDRSEGTSVNTHILQSEDANGVPTNPGGPMIYLLYRPSHYDILYKDSLPLPVQPLPQVIHTPSLQVQRVAFSQQQHSVQSTPMNFNLDLHGLLTMPGFGGGLPLQQPLQQSHHGFSTHYTSPIERTYAASPISSMSPISPGASSATTPSSTVPPYPTQPMINSSLSKPMVASSHPTYTQNTTIPVHSHLPPHPPSLQTHSIPPSELPSPSSAGGSFRPSKYEWEAGWAHEGPVQFQTSTFKNSHYNTAHYNNPNFQPEEWNPDTDDPLPPRKRSG
jgi:ubiquitin thioesterase protein OTUB1